MENTWKGKNHLSNINATRKELKGVLDYMYFVLFQKMVIFMVVERNLDTTQQRKEKY